jgi:predicted phage terminase large subunit-like protein
VESDTLNFTRYCFRHTSGGKQFIVGRHHRLICDKLNDVLQGKTRRLIINIAPRYGKTEVAVKNFIAMGLGINPASRFIHLSYSGTLAQDNSVAIKDIINSEAYSAIFPTRIKYGSDTKTKWETEQGGGVYATSTLGQITGFGAGAVDVEGEPYSFSGAIVIDDPIKPEDALSDVEREKVNRRFETTIRNRVNSRSTPIIIIMQRLHENDLCGYLQALEPDTWEVLSIPCLEVDERGEERALWPFKHTVEELHKIEAANSYVFDTQYMQNPKPIEGLMYASLRTYEIIPPDKGIRKNYTDTADTGADFLCSICYVETKTAMYITDVLYTNRAMEYTEPKTAEMLLRNDTQRVKVESNNGGRGFARNVERYVRENDTKTARRMHFKTFTQTANKQVRIFSRSAEVQNLIYFPADWESRWPQFANAVKNHRKEGKNLHDDAPDVLTGMTEDFRKAPEQLSDEQLKLYEDLIY